MKDNYITKMIKYFQHMTVNPKRNTSHTLFTPNFMIMGTNFTLICQIN